MMNKFIILLVTFVLFLSFVSAIESDKTYVFRIQKEGFYINPVSLGLFDSIFSEDSNLKKGVYHADLVTEDVVLYSVKFDLYSLSMTNPTEECFRDSGDPSCEEELYIYDESHGDVVLNFPYYKRADSINVYHNGVFLFNYELPIRRKTIFDYWPYFVGVIVVLIILIFILRKKKPKVIYNAQHSRARALQNYNQ